MAEQVPLEGVPRAARPAAQARYVAGEEEEEDPQLRQGCGSEFSGSSFCGGTMETRAAVLGSANTRGPS